MGHNSKYFTVAAVIVGVMAAATLLAFTEDRHAGWQLRPSLSLNQVHFVVRHSNGFDNWISGRDVPIDSFRGFSLSMLASPGSAKFEYVADAGRLLCEGRFLMGTGSGTYTFVPDPAFALALQQMGYDTPDDEQLFSMLRMDIHREFAREIRDAGLRASINDLLQLRIHGITMDYIRVARQAGYQNLTAEDYVQLRIHGVDSAYIRDLKSYGLKPDASDLTQMRIHGVTPEYLKGLKDAGYGSLRAEEVDQLRVHGVEPSFVQEARRSGYNFTPEELAQLRIHGVNGAYLKRLHDAGMRNLNAEQIANLRMHGVD
jgi:hypothetical protein